MNGKINQRGSLGMCELDLAFSSLDSFSSTDWGGPNVFWLHTLVDVRDALRGNRCGDCCFPAEENVVARSRCDQWRAFADAVLQQCIALADGTWLKDCW
jgi:hypothetical protein